VAQSEKGKRSIHQDRACDPQAEKIKELMVGRFRLSSPPLGSATRRMRIKLSLNAAASLSAIEPSYADQVLSFYRDLGVEPNVAFEVRQVWTALGLVAAGVGMLSFRLRYGD
jgi:hypothetical protein